METETEIVHVIPIKPDSDDALSATSKMKKKRVSSSAAKKSVDSPKTKITKQNILKSLNNCGDKSNPLRSADENSIVHESQIDDVTFVNMDKLDCKETQDSESLVVLNGSEIFEDENDGQDETNIGDNDCLVMEVLYDEVIEELDVWDEPNTTCDEEEQVVKDFLSKECCKRQCNTKFKCEELLLYRLELQSIDYNEHGVNQLDLVLLGLIHSLCRVSDEIRHSRRITQMKRKRIKMMFAFRGVSVCRAMFMFAHAIKIERLKRLIKRYKHDGIAPKPHGNYQRVPANAITVEQTKDVVEFLRNYARENAAIVPGRSSISSEDIKILPPNETKVRIFNKYKQMCAQHKCSCISVVSFRRLWNRYCPDIVIQRSESTAKGKETSEN